MCPAAFTSQPVRWGVGAPLRSSRKGLSVCTQAGSTHPRVQNRTIMTSEWRPWERKPDDTYMARVKLMLDCRRVTVAL